MTDDTIIVDVITAIIIIIIIIPRRGHVQEPLGVRRMEEDTKFKVAEGRVAAKVGMRLPNGAWRQIDAAHQVPCDLILTITTITTVMIIMVVDPEEGFDMGGDICPLGRAPRTTTVMKSLCCTRWRGARMTMGR